MFPISDDLPTERVPLVTLALIAAGVIAALVGARAWPALIASAAFAWLFGPSVEDALGRVRFAALLVAGGLVGAALDQGAAAVGAAAVAGVLGAYARLYPWARMLCLVTLPLLLGLVAVPALAVLALWVPVQAGLTLLDPGSVAVLAQLGTFVLGAVAAPLVARRVQTPESLLARGRAAVS